MGIRLPLGEIKCSEQYTVQDKNGPGAPEARSEPGVVAVHPGEPREPQAARHQTPSHGPGQAP